MRRRRAPIILVAIASFVALVASLPAQAGSGGWATKPSAQVGSARTLLGGEDLDRDGFDDFLVAHSSPPTTAGAVTVFSGAGGQEIVSFQGTQPFEAYGSQLSWVPDVDLDGMVDIAIGAEGPVIYSNAVPHVEIRSGRTGTLLVDITPPLFMGTRTIWQVLGCDDRNGDGRGDVAVLSAWPPDLAFYDGFTGSLLLTIPLRGFPHLIRGGKDITGDGVEDFLIGRDLMAPQLPEIMALDGATLNLLWTASAPTPQSQFGRTFDWIPDQNGDGIEDLAAGAPDAFLLGVPYLPGRVEFLSGATGAPLGTIVGQSTGFGGWVRTLGDVDGDGELDVLVSGTIYSLATGASIVGLLGGHGEPAGDVDGDGRADVLLYGGFGLPRVEGWADVRLTATPINPTFGTSIWNYDVEVEFATPGAWLTVTTADGLGATVVGNRHCTGLVLPLTGHQRVHAVRADAFGEASFAIQAMHGVARLVAIDLATCEYSNVVAL